MATFDERFILPTQLPELEDNRLFNDFQVTPGTKIGNILTGNNGEERYQTWPEAMARSGYSLGQNFIEGLGKVPFETLNLPVGNPNDLSIPEYSGATQVVKPNALGELIGMEKSWNIPSRESLIGRTQDLAGLAGMSSIPLAEKGALGAIGGKFYSTLENTIAGSKVQKATPEQWTSYLKNQPGVKPEELEFSLQGLGDKPLTKDQLAQHVADNRIKFGEVWKGGDKRPTQYSVSSTGGNISDAPPRMDFATQAEANVELAIRQSNAPNSYHSMSELPTGESRPKYESYQLPGGENYRELLMTKDNPVSKRIDKLDQQIQEVFDRKDRKSYKMSPEDDKLYGELIAEKNALIKQGENNYKSSHWDEPNVLAHIRMNDRYIPDNQYSITKNGDWYNIVDKDGNVQDLGSAGGKFGSKKTAESVLKDKNLKTLHVEEIQSDWHQAGRKHGYFDPGLKDKINSGKGPITDAEVQAVQNNKNAPPNAPFKKTWDELALKRVLSEAATKGYDAVSWTPGEAQAARYDLSKHYDNITATKRQDGSYNISGTQKGHKTSNALADRVTEDKLADTVGKELAEKIIKDNKEGLKGAIEYSGVDLKVGGEGIKAFYDTMLPAKANKLISKLGGKVEYENIRARVKGAPSDFTDHKVPIIKITPKMREEITQRGFPLYSSGIPTFTPIDYDPFSDKKKYRLIPVSGNPFE